MGKRSRTFELKHGTLLHTRVFEDGDDAPETVEFDYGDLRRWGYDLLSGTRDGKAAWFLAEEEDGRRAGDRYEDEEGAVFEVEALHEALPKDTRLIGRMVHREGQARLALSLEGAVQEARLAEIPAAELLVYYLDKKALFRVLGALRDVGSLATLEASHGQEGRGVPLDALPRVFHRALHDARRLNRRLGAGRIAFSGFGRAKDGRWRYRMVWMLPTLALFDLDVAEKVDHLIGALP